MRRRIRSHRAHRFRAGLATGAALALLALPAAALSAEADPLRVDPGREGSPPVRNAVVVLHPTEGSETKGVLHFEATENGLAVEGEVSGLEPGPHGTHVHIFGDCSAADGTSAGTHFNFDGSSEEPPEDIDRITGNLGNVEADADGRGRLDAVLPLASLQGPYSILGRAVVVHEKGNDPDQPPMGGAGGRVACGVVGIDAP